MNGSKILMIGGIVVTGVVIHKLYKRYQSAKDTDTTPTKDKEYTSPVQKDTPMDHSFAEPVSDVLETKETVVSSVKERHHEAAESMEESLNTIFKENDEEATISENSETLEETSNALNDLLK